MAHPASVDSGLQHAVNRFRWSKKFRLSAIFGPQHGIHGQTQDNMVEWEGFRDPVSGLPVFSLYGKVRRPTPAMLNAFDVMLVDLQDIGTRFYTYAATMAYVMEEAAKKNIGVVVLDRPNPINGWQIEGPSVDEPFVGFTAFLASMPVRHGMTLGELALSPVGLSSMTKLSPRKYVGQMMGIWFLAASLGNLIAGLVGGNVDPEQLQEAPALFTWTAVALFAAAGVLALLTVPIRRMMGNIDTSGARAA